MNKQLIFGLLFSLVLASCSVSKSKENSVTSSENWEFESVESVAMLPNFDKDSTIAVLKYALLPNENPSKLITDSLLAAYLGIPIHEANKAGFQKHVDGFTDEYLQFGSEDSSFSFPWWLHIDLDFCLVKQHFLKADFTTEVFTGGAHGNYLEIHHMIDQTNQRVLTKKDVVTDVKTLEKRAEQKFRAFVEIDANADLEESGFWFPDNQFALNENFFFDEAEITFVYNQYEVAPYVYGPISISFNWDEIKDILKLKLRGND